LAGTHPSQRSRPARACATIAGLARLAQIGVGAGLNFNDLDDIEAGSVDATFDNATGYHFGVFLVF